MISPKKSEKQKPVGLRIEQVRKRRPTQAAMDGNNAPHGRQQKQMMRTAVRMLSGNRTENGLKKKPQGQVHFLAVWQRCPRGKVAPGCGAGLKVDRKVNRPTFFVTCYIMLRAD
jgi:hypothetical protein